jgi:hypothetical protein
VGKSQPFSYTFSRAKDAGQNTTHLRFQLNGAHPAMADSQSCNMVNDSFTLTF